jgi:hypothetical protein
MHLVTIASLRREIIDGPLPFCPIATDLLSLPYLALQRLDHFLLLGPYQLTLREILPQFLQFHLHHPIFLQLLLVLLGQSLVVGHLLLQVAHLLQVLSQAQLFIVQTLFFL